MNPAHYELHGDIAVITFDNPPVNGLSLPLRQQIVACLKQAYDDERIKAIVLTGAGKGFCAGGDLKEIGTPAVFIEPAIAAHILPFIEAANKPVIAAIHGFAMGGGLEIALTCHYRISTPEAMIALPEVRVGLIPPSGSQRLPRLIGLEAALDFIVSAERVKAETFAATPLFDRLIGGDVLEAALAFAREMVAEGRPLALVRDRPVACADPDAFLAAAMARVKAQAGGYPAPLKAVEALAAAARAKSFDEGMAIAKKLHDELQSSPEAKALRDSFVAERRAQR
jgi:3-hydroxyacyl-CoA dehydrogenase